MKTQRQLNLAEVAKARRENKLQLAAEGRYMLLDVVGRSICYIFHGMAMPLHEIFFTAHSAVIISYHNSDLLRHHQLSYPDLRVKSMVEREKGRIGVGRLILIIPKRC